MERRFKGIAASPGIEIGKAVFRKSPKPRFTYQFLLNKSDVKKELDRFKRAVDQVKKEIKDVKSGLGHNPPLKEIKPILDTYLIVLSDPIFFKATLRRIKEEKINAEWALMKTVEDIEGIFGKIEDEYIKQRVQDIRYIAKKIFGFLGSTTNTTISSSGNILIADELSPTEATKLPTKQIGAFVTETGGLTSHTAIVAQALKLPAVVGVKGISQEVKNGDMVIVDGQRGIVIVNPNPDTLRQYKQRQRHYSLLCKELEHYINITAHTLDGKILRVMANVELFEEIPSVLEMGAEGIGLFRTEFFYLQHNELPNEEALYNYFKKVVKAIYPYPVTFRTLDFGGDKLSSYLHSGKEINPALGLRAIRLCLTQRDIFCTQLRAILRASQHGNVRLLFPLISSLEEIQETKQILISLKEGLEKEACKPFTPIPLGIMVEVPSAVAIIDLLVQEVDFISIGTNDLIQYALAIDRNNEQVAYLYQPLHPAVLRMLKQITDTAHQRGITVSVCGEMARDPIYTPLLVGLGIDEISLNVQNIPIIKKLICSLSFKEAQVLVKELLTFKTVQEIKRFYLQHIKFWFKNLEELFSQDEFENLEEKYGKTIEESCLHE